MLLVSRATERERAIRVMIVDDTDHVRAMLGEMLALDGFDVTGAAGGGEQAAELLSEAAPDVVIMDYKMPGMDGIEATALIRRQMPSVPVILYTAYLDDEIEERARAAGVTACIGKVEGLALLEREISALCLEFVDRT